MAPSETVYKQNLKRVGWASQRLILTNPIPKNLAHLTKSVFIFSLGTVSQKFRLIAFLIDQSVFIYLIVIN